MNTYIWGTLPVEEQGRLKAQLGIMELYAYILAERIANFK